MLTLYSDNDTWSVTLYGQSGDTPLKELRHVDAFTRVVGDCPRQAHWLDGTPLGGVVVTAGILDRYRRFVVDGAPVVTGFAAVGDAWACTNPSAGRGLSVGLVHAQALRHAVRGHFDDPARFARAWDEDTERHVTPFYRNQVAADRARIAEMTELRAGLAPPAAPSVMARFVAAATRDADVFRALIES
jgi:flavin-dependent dehydrogenase